MAAPGFRVGQLPGLARAISRNGQAHSITQYRHKSSSASSDQGANIWVFTHRTTQQTIYTLREKLDGFHDLKQLPFNGKKSKPSKIRKDYWYPMARIDFPKDKAVVGRSVFQKLRELKHLHEVSWPETLKFKTPDQFTDDDKKKIKEWKEQGKDYRPIRSKKELGKALNAQKPNTIADMAAILKGDGAGNLMRLGQSKKQGEAEEAQEIPEVVVNWANDYDKEYAMEWSPNVKHGRLENPRDQLLKPRPQAGEPAEASKDAA
ncbi:transcriptional regulation of mitochondrial recombination-domain-containing protein [Stachybotrys elegans]|uniref:Large ribosomal subunit protein mL67 n=1 Tax=Stachybotrys elegans TaxID=80388 RepID=A0A8K0SSW8_9HYPO|nr:transcriptional regulation of mitochondrial recombination-domain-containing protein [Stachybotrys elegans]